jgi:threonine/homoserine/homoserine lactone efflux protein
MGLSEILAFMLAATLLVTSPGPNGVLIATTVSSSGRTAGFANIAGFFIAFYVHGALSILGISIILVKSATAFAVVKYLGAAYLIYLGIRKLIASDDPAAEVVKRESLSRIYWQGLVVNLLNPKTALFFFAFLPQFVRPDRGNVTGQTLLLGALFVGMAIITDSMYALLASSLAGKLRDSRHFQKGQRYFAGLVYVGLGITTAFTGSKK